MIDSIARARLYSIPQDMDGRYLELGDRVLIPCRITRLWYHDSYANLRVETEQPLYPSENIIELSINSLQVVATSRRGKQRYKLVDRKILEMKESIALCQAQQL